ncbi:MAG TPA: prephenate dehydrogenase/arogenate dehydrogenase family protein [Vicinamibacterales bacterium]|nr:prephenate dehydrogenase/arogenate dehydrogenase family protein [Vicinamibacterales bacterium]
MSGSPKDKAGGDIRRIAIAGCGLIGGSIALAARARWPERTIVVIDKAPVAARAKAAGIADEAGESLALASDAELVVLAAPVLQNVGLLRELPAYVTRPVLVTDTGSTKRAMDVAARDMPAHITFIGGHPFAGDSRGGLESARADLFQGHPWALTASDDAGVGAVEAFVRGLGATPYRISPGEHDRIAAAVSHLPQLVATALMDVVGSAAGEEGLKLAGAGLLDTTRLASSPAGIWRDIARTNADEISALIDAIVATLTAMRASLAADDDVLERIFASAARWREALLRVSRRS